VRLDGRPLDLDGAAFGGGFHAVESHGQTAWRWTDGAATLALEAPGLVEITVHMTAQTWTRSAAPILRLVQAG
ncbi:MAG: hypothetical protein WA840_13325, partial [Caulobacteraceae bacterium]